MPAKLIPGPVQDIHNCIALMEQLKVLCRARLDELTAANPPVQSKTNAAMKRKSMDLSNELVKLRKSSIWS